MLLRFSKNAKTQKRKNAKMQKRKNTKTKNEKRKNAKMQKHKNAKTQKCKNAKKQKRKKCKNAVKMPPYISRVNGSLVTLFLNGVMTLSKMTLSITTLSIINFESKHWVYKTPSTAQITHSINHA